MSNNKQSSSVEWLLRQALKWNVDITDNSQYIQFPKGAIEQAKAMEKKQCVDFALKCMFAHVIPSQATREVVEKLFDEGLQ